MGSTEPVRVRIRGIYATALTRIMLERGFTIVQTSEVIRRRFGLPANDAPADVTLKSEENRGDELLVIGMPYAFREVVGALREALPSAIFSVSPVNLYSTHRYRVLERRGDECLVELESGLRGVLRDCRDDEGEATVVKAPLRRGEMPVLVPGRTAVGRYVIVSRGMRNPSALLSEHIRDPERRGLLLAASLGLVRRGYRVRWRSNAGRCSIEEAVKEAEELARILEEGDLEDMKGEGIGLVGLPLPSKELLDEVRASVVPTVRLHHSLKASGGVASLLVDYTERLIGMGVDRDTASRALLDQVVDMLSSQKRIEIIHMKPGGRVLRLTPGRVESIVPTGSGYKIMIKRRISGGGVYDGLNLEKRSGDYDSMIVETGSWRIIHRYYRDNGELLGEYVNINTPPEFSPSSIRYYDLFIDVVRLPGGETKIIDRDELEEAYASGLIGETLYRRALEEAEKAARGEN